MTNSLMLRILAIALLTISMQTALAGNAEADFTGGTVFRFPTTTTETVDSAKLITRVERALSRYATGCAAHDEHAIADALTRFAVIEYPTTVVGRFVSVDAIAAEKCWAASALEPGRSHKSQFWIFPTREMNFVFVQYTLIVGTPGAAQSVQALALVELEGDRIARIRDYADPGYSGSSSDE
jgi:hypothetical protein